MKRSDSSSARRFAFRSVATQPGAIELTRTPEDASSLATDRVKNRMPPFEVQGQYLVPALGAEREERGLEAGPTRVVEEDVQPPEGLDGPAHHRLDLGAVSHVRRDDEGPAADRVDLLSEGLEVGLSPGRDGDISTRLCEPKGYHPPDPTRRAGDERGLPLKGEQFCRHRLTPRSAGVRGACV